MRKYARILQVSNRAESLRRYRRKRDPDRTPEPFGGAGEAGHPAQATRFVIQLHRARRLHYDFRFAHAGVLKSWAVPKGFPPVPEERRLAVEVEDHPLEYGDFEGLIPAGNYGAGAVIVWDRGLLEARTGIEAALVAGKLEVVLTGYKLRGTFVLVRRHAADRNWLLLRKADRRGLSDVRERDERSIFSGRTVEEVAAGTSPLERVRSILAGPGAPVRTIPASERRPMLAVKAAHPPAGPGWVFEIKYDGIRALAGRDADEVRLHGRSGRSLSVLFPELRGPLSALAARQFLIDGEIIAPDASGRPSLAGLQARLHARGAREIQRLAATRPVELVAFDLLALEGRDCRSLPLLDRKRLLEHLVPSRGPVSYCEHLRQSGAAVYEAAVASGLEGIVAKRVDAPYIVGRAASWQKIVVERRDDFVIGGYTEGRGGRGTLGALLIGQYTRDPAGDRLVYAGRVGSGLSEAMLRHLSGVFAGLASDASPFASPPRLRGVHHLRPALVCEVRFAEWTPAGQLRHPRFVGLRADKAPTACRREAIPEAGARDEPPRRRARPRPHDPEAAAVPGRGRSTRDDASPALSNLKKVFWPDAGYTKGDLVAYYRHIAPRLLPYLRDRPLVLTRYPDGITGQHFYQQDAPTWVPDWVRRARLYVKEGGREIDYFICNDVETLVYIANLGTIPLHVWSSRVTSPDRPDWLILDLDPGEAPFSSVITVARGLRTLLRALGLRVYVKTSGSTGLHLLVPLAARYRHVEVRQFAELVARVAAERHADVATVERRPARRRGKLYIDYGQNGYGRTIVAPYAVRALPGAPVSAPLRWAEVGAGLSIPALNIRTLPRQLRGAHPFRAVLGPGCDLEAAVARLEGRL
jgi:bifunctional non-homologous end joining protein LigD